MGGLVISSVTRRPALACRYPRLYARGAAPYCVCGGRSFPLVPFSGKIDKIFSLNLVDGTRLALVLALVIVVLGNCGACNECHCPQGQNPSYVE